jgi:predicted phosphodiesterase
MRIVCLSDTHNLHGRIAIPEGDVLIHAGDFTMRGTAQEVAGFDAWLGAQPHRDKIVVAGNHDFLFEREPGRARELLTAATYLCDSGVTAGGLRFWGSPWQPWFMDWAFNLPRGPALGAKWSLIPDGVDVLVTHSPPHGILDEVTGVPSFAAGDVQGPDPHVGCEELRKAIERLQPRLHVFGHIHEGYGRESRDGVAFVNASICDRHYRPLNPPVVVDL